MREELTGTFPGLRVMSKPMVRPHHLSYQPYPYPYPYPYPPYPYP